MFCYDKILKFEKQIKLNFMEIKFQTKEESNEDQLNSFLKLSKIERLYHFFAFAQISKQLPVKKKYKNNPNFILELKTTRK